MDVFEHLILIMIIRREIINFSIQTRHYELLGVLTEKEFLDDKYFNKLQAQVDILC